MHRRILTTVVAVALLAMAAPAGAHHREGPCDIHWRDGGSEEIRRDVRRLILCAWDRFRPGHGGPRRALEVARCESGFWPWAVGGSNLGVFQHQARYWPRRFELLVERNPLRASWELSPSALDARTNVIVTALYVRRFGWSAWACA
ncbi:MAG TPA: hypothetical protein VNO79_13955 [Actinomycetota bacterium]|nr:hypothetical protein [Actinomycetota bacterium]